MREEGVALAPGGHWQEKLESNWCWAEAREGEVVSWKCVYVYIYEKDPVLSL